MRIIVTESAHNVRAKARESLSGRWKPAVIVSMLFSVLSVVPTLIFDSFLSFGSPQTFTIAGQTYTMQGTNTSILSLAYIILIVAPLTMGMNAFFLQYFRNRINDTELLYSGFKMFAKSIGLFCLRAVFVFLWSLLFIVPGIIAFYRYSQAYYIMLDNPEMGCLECINESKRLMNGNKGKLFCIQISYIGWILLAAVPAVIVTTVLSMIQGTNQIVFTGSGSIDYFILAIISFVFSAGTFWVDAYMQNANVAFYEILTGKYAQTGYQQPVNPQEETRNLDMYTGRNELYRQNVEGNNDENDRQ